MHFLKTLIITKMNINEELQVHIDIFFKYTYFDTF